MTEQPHTLADLAHLFTRVATLEQEVQELRESSIPPVLPLKQVPGWYQQATGAPEEPVSGHQLRRWISHPERLKVDWLLRDGRSLYVDCARFVEWLRRMPSGRVRVREGRR